MEKLNKENRKILSQIISYGYDNKLTVLELTTLIEDNKAMMLDAQNEGRNFLNDINNNPKLYAYEVVNEIKGITHPSKLERVFNVLTYISAMIIGISLAMIILFNLEGEESFTFINKAKVFYDLNITLYLIIDIFAFITGLYLLNNLHLKYRSWKLYYKKNISLISLIYKQLIYIALVISLYGIITLFPSYKTLISINMLFLIIPCLLIIVTYYILGQKSIKDII